MEFYFGEKLKELKIKKPINFNKRDIYTRLVNISHRSYFFCSSFYKEDENGEICSEDDLKRNGFYS
jgi:hypothetical protein